MKVRISCTNYIQATQRNINFSTLVNLWFRNFHPSKCNQGGKKITHPMIAETCTWFVLQHFEIWTWTFCSTVPEHCGRISSKVYRSRYLPGRSTFVRHCCSFSLALEWTSKALLAVVMRAVAQIPPRLKVGGSYSLWTEGGGMQRNIYNL